jgi:integrase
VRYSGDYDFYSVEEINAPRWCGRDGAGSRDLSHRGVTGLRPGELVALRWRDVDFAGRAIRVRANYSFGQLVTPKSGKVRTVPMVPDVSEALARLRRRPEFTRDEDPVFVRPAGGHLVADVMRRRYVLAVERAQLRPLPFHSLRHHFGSIAVNRASLVQVQSWMGHSHIQTTARYLHAKKARPAMPSCSPAHLQERQHRSWCQPGGRRRAADHIGGCGGQHVQPI